jgi:hypothetical protein
MKRKIAMSCLIALLAFASSRGRAQAPVPVPSFTISASNITMPSSGEGPIPFTITSVNGFAGSIGVNCNPPNPATGVREPGCEGGPAMAPLVLTANGTATGGVYIDAIDPLPAHEVSRLNLPGHGRGASWALAGVLLLGFGLRRRKGWSGSVLLTLGLLIGLTGLGACGGPVTLTPGVYTYTLNAFTSGGTSPSISTSTTANVTVPPGIVVQPGPGPL